MITRSPSRIHILFFILPGIRPILCLLSAHITLILELPSSCSVIPNISLSSFFGKGTRINSSSRGSTFTSFTHLYGLSQPLYLDFWLISRDYINLPKHRSTMQTPPLIFQGCYCLLCPALLMGFSLIPDLSLRM